MDCVIREVRQEDWRELRELRLAALADPVAPYAFNERYEVAADRSPTFWKSRAGQAQSGRAITTFVAELPTGRWAGMVVVYVESGAAHVVGVYLRPEQRGSGVADRLFDAARGWAWRHEEVTRMRLEVHERNARAESFYRRYGFVRTGVCRPDPNDVTALEWEMTLERPVAGP